VAARSDDDAQMIVHRELLFTETLARLVRQLRYGKVDPSALYSTWNFSPPPGVQERAQTLDECSKPPRCRAHWRRWHRRTQPIAACSKPCHGSPPWPPRAAGQASPTVRRCVPARAMRAYAALRARLQAEGWLAEEGKGRVKPVKRMQRVSARATSVGKASARGDATRYDKALAEAVQRFQRRTACAPTRRWEATPSPR
jgi:hypothetical protein